MSRAVRATFAGAVLAGVCLLLAVAVLVTSAKAATPAAGVPLEEANQLISAGNAPRAYELLKPFEKSAAGEVTFDYLFGLAALDSGYAADAIAAFERVLAIEPSHAQARAELGRAYFMLGDPEAARRELAMVNTTDIPPQVRAVLDRYLTAIDRTLEGGGTGVDGYAQVRVGYDTNASNSTADTRILIPAFAGLGTAVLSPKARERDAFFAELSSGVSVSHGLSRQTRLFATLSGAARLNKSESDLNQANADLIVGVSYADPEWGSFSIGPQAQTFRVDGRSYRNSVGALAQWQPRLDGPNQLSLFGQYSYLDYPNDSLRNANRVAGGGTFAHQLSGEWQPSLFVGLSGGAEEVNSDRADHLDYWFVAARAGGSLRPTERLSVFGDISVERREYGANDPLFLTAREDTVVNAGLGAQFQVTPSISAGPEIRYTHANSNIVLNDYDRLVASVSIRTNF